MLLVFVDADRFEMERPTWAQWMSEGKVEASG